MILTVVVVSQSMGTPGVIIFYIINMSSFLYVDFTARKPLQSKILTSNNGITL